MDEEERGGVAHPHDLLVRHVLADADIAADLLRNYLAPELVSAVNFDSLKRESGDTVDSTLSKLVGDLRYSARFKDSEEDLKVLLFVEHQSRPDRWMSFRMLEYVCAAYRQQLPTLKQGMLFPYPLAVVLHHGASPWKKIPLMRELIAMRPGVPSAILELPICLIDAAAMPLDELHGHPMVCALLESLQSASMGTLQSRMRGIFARLRGLGGDHRIKAWVIALTRYYGALRGEAQNIMDELVHAYTGLYDTKEAGIMATTMLEQIQREGIAKGKAEGKIESMITFLETRFGGIPSTLQRKLRNMRDDGRIESMLKLAATCQNIKEFQKAL